MTECNCYLYCRGYVSSLASGFIANEHGLVITNRHVARNLINPRVIMTDGREFPVEVKAFSRTADLALLQVSRFK